LSNSVVRLASIDSEDWTVGAVADDVENLRRHLRLNGRGRMKVDRLRLGRQPSIMLRMAFERVWRLEATVLVGEMMLCLDIEKL
jgi:hypothetical protein